MRKLIALPTMLIAAILFMPMAGNVTVGSAAQAIQMYKPTKLKTLEAANGSLYSGSIDASPSDISSQGVVLINSFSADSSFQSIPFTDNVEVITPLADGSRFASGAQINDLGEVAGHIAALDDPSLDHVQAVVWRNGVIVELPELDVDKSQAYGINNAGVIVGNASLTSPDGVLRHAAMWTGDQITDLGTLGGPGSNASSINYRGTIVGYSMVTDRTGTFPTVWESGLPVELPTPDGRNGGAVGINESGTIIGVLVDADVNYYPIRWIDGEPEYLPLISERGEGAANGINNRGQIVGWTKRVKSDAGVQVAVLWDGEDVVDLNKRIPAGGEFTLISAIAINDAGQIAVEAVDVDDSRHALLLTPIDSTATRVENAPAVSFAVDLRRTR